MSQFLRRMTYSKKSNFETWCRSSLLRQTEAYITFGIIYYLFKLRNQLLEQAQQGPTIPVKDLQWWILAVWWTPLDDLTSTAAIEKAILFVYRPWSKSGIDFPAAAQLGLKLWHQRQAWRHRATPTAVLRENWPTSILAAASKTHTKVNRL